MEREEEEKEEKKEREEEEGGGAGGDRRAVLTTRDLAALAWLVEQRAASLHQVQDLLGQIAGAPITGRRARQIVARWEQMDVAHRWRVWHGEPAVVCPTVQAAYLVGLSRWRRPGIGTLRHLLAVSAVRLVAAPFGGPRRWICESELRTITPVGAHLADGAWIEPDGRRYAVEVELSPHGRTRVGRAIASLLAQDDDGQQRWTGIVYVCSRATIVQVQGVVAALAPAARQRVTVRPLP